LSLLIMVKPKKLLIVTTAGQTFEGNMMATKLSPLGYLEWVQLETKKGSVRVNSPHIVAIIEHHDIKRKLPS